MPAQRSSSVFRISVDGTELPDELQLALLDASIEDELNLPDACELVFRDPVRAAISRGRFEPGTALEVKLVSEATPSGASIFEGEITAIEAEVDRDSNVTIVRGYDHLHRLQRGTHTETYLDMTYGDIVTAVVQRHGLDLGDAGSNTVVHEAVVQFNETDWEFVTRLAARIGHEVVMIDGKVALRPPPTTDDAPPEGEVDSDRGRQLVIGGNVLQLRSTISGGEQVRDVSVRGWDPKVKEAVEGLVTASSSADSAAAGMGSAEVAEKLQGGTLVLTPAVESAEVASDEAEATMQQLGSAVAELEGVVFGNPDLRAGRSVSLVGLGKPFDGNYVLTSCRHSFTAATGYRTAIRVSGRQNRTLLGVIGGGGRGRRNGEIGGVVPALVSDVDDPEGLARVKVTFPWLAKDVASHWARVSMLGAGPERGLVILPEVDDEVLVAFEHGDARYPVVIGGLYNGQDTPPVTPVDSGAVVTRAFVSRTGHRIEFHDEDEAITLITGDENHRIVLDASGQKLLIESSGDVEIRSQKTVSLHSPQGMSLECDGELELKGMGVTIDAGAGEFTAKGMNATLNGSVQASLEGGASAVVKGGMVLIN